MTLSGVGDDGGLCCSVHGCCVNTEKAPKSLALLRNTKDRKHLQSTQSSHPTSQTKHQALSTKHQALTKKWSSGRRT